uniref:PDZ domain-containing protein n=1 Tax=Heterorhabditis bacteriophora TaxID=37862 RepID=A0A1I7WN32_HETBA
MEREVRMIEERWMEKVRLTMQERDSLMLKTEQLEEQLENIRVDVNRAVAYRLEMEESRNRIKNQLENVQRDYEETMAERSSVLEENTRMGEERDRLRQTVHNLNQTLNEMRQSRNDDEVQNLSNKLEHTRRLLQLNMEETASANVKRNEAIEKLGKLKEDFTKLLEARDEALRKVKEANSEREPIVDLWNTHTVEIALPFPKPNLGIVLSGGCTDDRYSIHSPIYVKEVLMGSPLEHMLKRLDHILIVNNIDVTDMDQRSVIDILKNSHHLKMVIRRRANANKIHEITVDSNHNIGMELGNGVFVNAVDPLGTASKEGLGPGHRIVHVNHVPIYDAKHAEKLIKYSNGQIVIGVLDGKKEWRVHSLKNTDQNRKRLYFPRYLNDIFGRYNSEKPRNVIAKANIASTAQETAFYRQGSLRIPSQQQVASELVRYGSLRWGASTITHTVYHESISPTITALIAH